LTRLSPRAARNRQTFSRVYVYAVCVCVCNNIKTPFLTRHLRRVSARADTVTIEVRATGVSWEWTLVSFIVVVVVLGYCYILFAVVFTTLAYPAISAEIMENRTKRLEPGRLVQIEKLRVHGTTTPTRDTRRYTILCKSKTTVCDSTDESPLFCNSTEWNLRKKNRFSNAYARGLDRNVKRRRRYRVPIRMIEVENNCFTRKIKRGRVS